MCIISWTALAMAGESKIHVSPGKYLDYYHIQFELTSDNCELEIPISERKPKYAKSNEYKISEGGQFEVFVRKSHFPIPAPHSKSEFLILRMSWTDPDSPGADQKIAGKQRLFNAIRKMKSDGNGRVNVILELNPYVTVLRKKPLSLELSGRNIFFRHADGEYIDYLGRLK
jgi:hypothetical protein